jgi:D-serine deaminase-like pyridoxal phosphate-dependent protein
MRPMNLLQGTLRPRDRGAPHAPPFSEWNAELRRTGPGKPVLLLDLDALEHNLRAVREAVAPGLAVRVVAKSLPSLPLLRRVMEGLGTRRLMVFDESIALLAAELPDADFLLGKPLPVQAAAAFYAERARAGDLAAGERVRWLVDGPERLAQYAALARQHGVKVRVCIEVDVGLHRGGVAEPADLRLMLQAIAADPAHLELGGLMGYDAHVTSAPPLFSSVEGALGAVVARYAAFREVVDEFTRSSAGAARGGAGGSAGEGGASSAGEARAGGSAGVGGASSAAGDLVFNGGGSKTYMLHRAGGPIDEVALGSCLVMPTDFDVATLAAHRPALFIATPVLKRLQGTRVPFLEWMSPAWSRWDPNRQLTYFVFGGGWMARPVSPAGLTNNPIYGFSTNQALFNGSERTGLQPDDWVFLRPTQSERVMQEFGAIRLLGAAARDPDTWSVIGFSP